MTARERAHEIMEASCWVNPTASGHTHKCDKVTAAILAAQSDERERLARHFDAALELGEVTDSYAADLCRALPPEDVTP